MTTYDDRVDPLEETGPPMPRRYTRRKASLGIAATALVAAIGLDRVAAGQSTGKHIASPPGPMASSVTMPSPAASPAASPGASPAAGPSGTAHVSILNFSFMPAILEVSAGTTVVWTNNDDIPHTVTSDDRKAFTSAALDTGDTFSHRFNQRGTYPYFCSFHPFMTAKVIVH